jgi:hypothetical protein
MDILLIAGLWLDRSAWDNVAAQLEARGHHAVPVALPGQGDGNTSATLADQLAGRASPGFSPAQAREWTDHGEVSSWPRARASRSPTSIPVTGR